MSIRKIAKSFNDEVRSTLEEWTLPVADDNSINADLSAWNSLKPLFDKISKKGHLFSKRETVSYINFPYGQYSSGILDLNDNIHVVSTGNVVVKIKNDGTLSTYNLIVTNFYGGYLGYWGGVLSPNGDIHFVPYDSKVGQKVDVNGVVSTYSLVYTTPAYGAYIGGVQSPNGDVHFVPNSARVGQKVDINGVVSTYSLINTSVVGYCGGVLSPNGDIHFIPNDARVGQKVDINGVVSTYSLIHTNGQAYAGGVLDINGNVHFVPNSARVGQKVDINGVVSTYSLINTTNQAYMGGVLAPNGDVHFVPYSAGYIGQKVSSDGVVSTYPLLFDDFTQSFCGGILNSKGDVWFLPSWSANGSFAQKITTNSSNFTKAVCLSPFFNKF